MKRYIPFFLFFFIVTFSIACEKQTNTATPDSPKQAQSDKVDSEVAVLETDMGKIVIEFFPGDAPKHVENFKKLTKEGFYDGTAFHRIIPDVIIQGGDPNSKSGPPETWGMGQPGQPTVPAEFNSRKHLRGILSAARRGDDVNSATSQFFICERPKPEWDGQYSAYGKVVEGMNVVDIIANSPKVEGTDRPVDKVVIKRAYLENRDKYGPTPEYK